MKPVFVALFSIAAAASAGAATPPPQPHILVPPPGRPTPALRVLRGGDSFAAHRVRTYQNARAFAATLTAEEAEELRTSGEVMSVTPVVERHLVDDTGAQPQPTPDLTTGYTLRQTVPYGIDMIHARDVWPA